MKRRSTHTLFNLDQKGGIPHGFSILLFVLIAFAVIGTFKSVAGHAVVKGEYITSGTKGNCLDVYHSNEKNGAIVDSSSCNNTEAQSWQLDGLHLTHENLCMTLLSSSKVDLESCSSGANQVWIRDNTGFINPNKDLCLSTANNKSGSQLIGASCSSLGSVQETWSPSLPISCVSDSSGQKVACSAINEWTAWNKAGANHESLLNTYTDGAAYEEWCADFVSYTYKAAGQPFTNGEADGWDESNANNIVNQGFNIESASSYIPKAGDIGMFSYDGGHVEIVISGGSQPTFIYGNSGDIDPSTNNGQMATNTITHDGKEGHLLYYLTPITSKS
jgi:hypothetical protein